MFHFLVQNYLGIFRKLKKIMECGGGLFQKYGVNKKKIFYIYIWLITLADIIENQEVQEV